VGTPAASLALGYREEDLAAAPEGANMGLGCGNPQAFAALQAGDTVLDLGSGGGFDCFLAARHVGPTGHVIGVDMTPDMVSKARKNATRLSTHAETQADAARGTGRVEFRLGEVEHLPVADASVDVVLSNCVINLSPDKRAVFAEAYRVLKPGGRLAISDVVKLRELPTELAQHTLARTGCVTGAATRDALLTLLSEAGFEAVRVDVNEASRTFIRDWLPGSSAENYVAAATIEGRKPLASCCAPSCCDPVRPVGCDT
jgi:SAM-dependent methyltransferase